MRIGAYKFALASAVAAAIVGANAPLGHADTTVKPPLSGLLTNMWYPGATSQPGMGGWIVGIPWSQLQPTPTGPLNTYAIDRVLSLKPAGTRIKIRITAGVNAPDWVKSLGGPPIAVSDRQSGTGGTIGRFWTDAFGAAYDLMQATLAAKYDGNPDVAEVVIDRCTTVFPEPYIRQSGASAANLLAAGYTAALDEQCHQQEIDAHQVWATTPSGLAFNPYSLINPDGSITSDEAFTDQMMAYCRQQLGARCVLENDSIRYPQLVWDYSTMYQHMQAMGGNIAFQLASPSIVGDVLRTLQWAKAESAGSVEVSTVMSSATLAQMVAAFGSAPPTYTPPLYTLDGWGGLHPDGNSPALACSASWPGWDIARGVAVTANGQGAYTLDGWGGVHQCGNAPSVAITGYWPGWDIARGITVLADGQSGYVLDGFGGIHAYGGAPAMTCSWYGGRDVARGLVMTHDGTGAYIVDSTGGVHACGAAAPLRANTTFSSDIARGIVLLPDGSGGYVLDAYGGVHPFGAAPSVSTTGAWPGWDIARGITLAALAPGESPGGWVIDGWGGLHPFGTGTAVSPGGYWPGWDIARGVSTAGSSAGAHQH